MLTGVMNELSAARTDAQAPAWRHLPALQQPAYPDEAALADVVADLRRRPPLVFAGEVDSLRNLIAQASTGDAFVLMGGDCAESFTHNTADNIRLKVQTILQMLDAYLRSGTTLNLIRAFTMGGYADLREVHSWNRGFTANPAYKRFESFAEELDRAMRFMEAAGVDFEALRQVDFYAAHEALLLEYEDAMIREDSRSGRLYDTSAHMLWVGERTREADGAHVAILAGVHNPVGVKVGPTTSPDDVLRLMDRLNPDGVPGRLSLITRMGAGRIRESLPTLVEAVRADGRPVTWITDPMHGNTITSDNGYKTRRFETILDEIRGFFEVHRSLGTAPGGIHVELTGDDVTEVLGGGEHIDEAGLAEHYETLVDPRLNHQQSLEVAFEIAEMLKG